MAQINADDKPQMNFDFSFPPASSARSAKSAVQCLWGSSAIGGPTAYPDPENLPTNHEPSPSYGSDGRSFRCLDPGQSARLFPRMLFSCEQKFSTKPSADFADGADKSQRHELSALIRVIRGKMPWLRLGRSGKSAVKIRSRFPGGGSLAASIP